MQVDQIFSPHYYDTQAAKIRALGVEAAVRLSSETVIEAGTLLSTNTYSSTLVANRKPVADRKNSSA